MVCSASESKAVKTLILKPHLIPLIPAKFLAQSWKIDLKGITCTECSSAVPEQCLRHSHRGHGQREIPLGWVRCSRAGLQCQHWCARPFYLPPTELWTPWSIQIFPSVWRIRFNYIFKRQYLKTRICVFSEPVWVPAFDLAPLAQHRWEKLQRPWMGKVTPQTSFTQRRDAKASPNLLKKIKNWENKHEVTQAMPWLGVMTGLKKKIKEKWKNRRIYRNIVPSPLYSGWEYV